MPEILMTEEMVKQLKRLYPNDTLEEAVSKVIIEKSSLQSKR